MIHLNRLIIVSLVFLAASFALAQDSRDTPPAPARIRVSADVQQAQLFHHVSPRYPDDAMKKQIQGSIVLHAVISKDGTIQKLEAVSGPPELIPAALKAVKKWKYKPTILEGRPVEVDTTINVVFALTH